MIRTSFREMISRARVRAVVVTSSVLLVAGSMAGLATSASAAPAVIGADGTSDAVAPLSADAQGSNQLSAAAAAIDYWTPERLAAAVAPPEPKLGPNPKGSEASTDLAASQPGYTAPSGAVVEPSGLADASPNSLSAAASVNASATVGVVAFTDPADPGVPYRCSGAALNSNSKRLVITAGHCVYDGGHFMNNVVFIPFYNDGSRPYGTFAARSFTTFDAWRNNSSRDHDIAMFTTSNNASGQVLVDTVGGNGLSWNYSHSIFLTILAYPVVPPYDGKWQQYCQGTTRRVGLFDGRIELGCGFTGGSSGGPWFRDYDNNSGLGQVNGVMSTLATTGYNRSSYFDDKVKTMFDATPGD